jgi:hypothetical protein
MVIGHDPARRLCEGRGISSTLARMSCTAATSAMYLSLAAFRPWTFQLMATNGLSQIADRIRKDLGFAPMHPMDEYTDDTCDNDGWYDFYVGINGYTESHMDSCIEFVVVNSNSPDDEERYTIDLTEEEQRTVFSCLDEQCRKHLEKRTCEEQMEEKYCWRK